MKSIRWVISSTTIVAACGGEPAADAIRSETSQVGDTIVVISQGEPELIRIDGVQVIWQSESLENPRDMLAFGGRLYVGDPTRLHIISQSDGHVRSVGQDGAGPGEFRSVSTLGQRGRDTVAVHDVTLQRISFFAYDGEYLGEARATPTVPFVNPVAGSGLVLTGNGTLSLWRENNQDTRPTRTALVWRDLETDTAAVHASWAGATWKRMGEFIVQEPLFGPEVVAVVGAEVGIAVGDGVQYCIRIISLDESQLRKVCRERHPVPVGAGIRRPDLSRVESVPRREAFAALIAEQTVAEHMPSFDRLLFDEQGRLWVRTVGPELAESHPYLRRWVPELVPAHRIWDVFNASGRLVGAVGLPSHFEPRAITSRHIYGFTELESGELAIGAVAVPF